jgi:RNA polymerase sigma factor (sigma-70 family)
MCEDYQLLRDYAVAGSEEAFDQLIRRHLGLVYYCALRRTGDASLAEEVAQSVFTDLARKALTFNSGVVVSAWLHRAACLEAEEALRAERRRRARETAALADQMTMNSESPVEWEQMAPVLDSALNHLRQPDREAILLRFFEQRSLAEVGAALGSNEDAAQKRVGRALEKLRVLLARRGVTSTAVALSSVLSAHAAQVPPPALSASLTAASFSGAAKGAGGGFGLLKLIAAHKLHISLAAAIAAFGLAASVLVHNLPKRFSALAGDPPSIRPTSGLANPSAVVLLQACAEAMDHASLQCEITDHIRVETKTYFQRLRPDGSLEKAQVQSGQPFRVRLKNREGEWMIDENEAVRYDFQHDNHSLVSDLLDLYHSHPEGVAFTLGPDEILNGVLCHVVSAVLTKPLARRLADELGAKLSKEGRFKGGPKIDTLQFIAERRTYGVGAETNLLFKYKTYDGNGSLLDDLTADYQALGPDVPADVFEIPPDLPVFIASSPEQLAMHHASQGLEKRKTAWAGVAKMLSDLNGRRHPVPASPGGAK